MRKGFLAILFAFVLAISSAAFASDNDLAYKGFNELSSITTSESGDLVAVYDSSTDTVKKQDASNPTVAGDVTFRENLLATGRKGGASTVSSSSTALAPSTLPYTVVRKCIGGSGGLDETDGGTRLQNGTPGQMIVLIAITVEGSGTWIVTPDTSLTFTTLTFDAAGETTTLLYVNDTVGWVVFANYGTTVAPIVTDFI